MLLLTELGGQRAEKKRGKGHEGIRSNKSECEKKKKKTKIALRIRKNGPFGQKIYSGARSVEGNAVLQQGSWGDQAVKIERVQQTWQVVFGNETIERRTFII